MTSKKPRPDSRSKVLKKTSYIRSSRSRSQIRSSAGCSSRLMQRRIIPAMEMPHMRMPRYEHIDTRYRRPPPEFYDPYMMARASHNWGGSR